MKLKNILVIGGGTGTYTVLKGLRAFPVNLSVIISMTDSGGSNKVLRDEFGLLPTSDIRQCIVALASTRTNGLIRDLFTYRYSQGTGITGMTFGNLFMVALTDLYGSQEKAIEKTCQFLDVRGNILPVTFDNTNLVARYESGRQVLGEHLIDDPDETLGKQKIIELEVFPPAKANPKALKAIKEADLIVIGPGDLYTSIICNLVVDNIGTAIKKSKAKKMYVLNLMNKFGQTNQFTADDYLSEIEKYLGKNTIDYCLVNTNHHFSKSTLKRYQQENASLVVNNLRTTKRLKIIKGDFVSEYISDKVPGDRLKRSFIRHDSDKLAKAIYKLI